MPDVLFHYTSAGAAKAIAQYGYIKLNAPMPPRFMDRRAAIPTVAYLSDIEARSGQRWAGAPDTGVRGLSYLDRAACRIAVRLEPTFGPVAVPFRKWALSHNIPFAWVDEFRKGGSTDSWWVIEREIPKAEWQEVAFWNGMRYVPAFTRKAPWTPDEVPLRGPGGA